MNAMLLEENALGQPCPFKSAQSMDDGRLCKMLLEMNQMLQAGLILNGAPVEYQLHTKSGKPYGLTHQHHPCTKWIATNRSNWLWGYCHARSLALEYTRRYGKVHACETSLEALPHDASRWLPMEAITPFPLAMPDEFKDESDPVGSYRRYYHTKRNVYWTRTLPPTWWKGTTIEVKQ
jgi:hypothetical protein